MPIPVKWVTVIFSHRQHSTTHSTLWTPTPSLRMLLLWQHHTHTRCNKPPPTVVCRCSNAKDLLSVCSCPSLYISLFHRQTDCEWYEFWIENLAIQCSGCRWCNRLLIEEAGTHWRRIHAVALLSQKYCLQLCCSAVLRSMYCLVCTISLYFLCL